MIGPTDRPPEPFDPPDGSGPEAPGTLCTGVTAGPPGLFAPPEPFGPDAPGTFCTGVTAGPPGPFPPPDPSGPDAPGTFCTGVTAGPPGPFAPSGPLPGEPGGRWAFEFGSILLNWSLLNWSFCTCVCAVALSPDWTLPIAVEALFACFTDASFELFNAGTATIPIGPSAFGPSFNPCSPAEIAANLDCRSPALLCNPCMDDSFMPNPELPVGPPDEGGGDGGGADWLPPEELGLPSTPPPRAMLLLRSSQVGSAGSAVPGVRGPVVPGR
ncbi:hypothetical protein [Saccharothrix hoggarensis]